MRASLFAAAGMVLGLGWSAAAQPPPAARTIARSEETIRSLHLAERNQLGILQYCQAMGVISAEIVALQRDAVKQLPAATVAGVDEAEAAGKRGIVAFGTSQSTFEEAAKGEGMPAALRCKHMAMTVQVQAGHLPTW